MAALLAFFGRHAAWMLFAGVFLGLLFPALASLLRPLLPVAVVLLLLIALLRVDWPTALGYLRRPLLIGVLTAWMLLASPVLAWILLPPLGLPEGLTTALILMAAAPPILSGAAFALLLGLDAALAVVVVLVSTLLTPLTLPPLALGLLGIELAIGVGELMARLALVVGLAYLGALGVRRWLGAARIGRVADQLDGVMVLMLLLFAVAIMDGVTATLYSRPGVVALWLAAAMLANPALQALAALVFWRLGVRAALTAGILSGNCNMGLLLAALSTETDYDVILFFAVAQIPMYMTPAILLPIYRRLLARLEPQGGAQERRDS